MRITSALVAIVTLLAARGASAHLNSPDTFVEDVAGPHAVLVGVRMPAAVPGEARVEVRLQDLPPAAQVPDAGETPEKVAVAGPPDW